MYTTMLAALEEITMKVDEAVYHRVYSWWILVQTWCTLRFSDHRGASPQEVKVDASGLVAILRRSKTIGTDKSIVSRSTGSRWIVLGQGTHLVVNWLECASGGRKLRARLRVTSSLGEPLRLPKSRAEVRPSLRSSEQNSERAYGRRLEDVPTSRHELLDSSFGQGVHADGDSSVSFPERRAGLSRSLACAGERPLRQDSSQKDRQHATNGCTRDQDKERWSAC